MDSTRPVTLNRIGMILFLLAVLLLLANVQRGLQQGLAPATAPEPTPPQLDAASPNVAAAANYPPPVTRPPGAVTATNNSDFVSLNARVVRQAQIVALPTALPPATLVPLPSEVNGIALETFILLPGPVGRHVRVIYERGLARGRDPHAFSKIGDSSIADGYFLTRFDEGEYELGPYAFLQLTLERYAGSFGRDSVTVREGMHSWSILDPFWADKSRCEPEETPLACEDRLHNPSVVIVRLGTNDFDAPAYFEKNMREIIEMLLGLDIVPILGTKADRIDGFNSPNNEILRALAAEYQLPLWDFDIVAATLPGRGLAPDGVHLTTFYPHDYDQAQAYERGHAMQNLTALLMLEQMWRLVTDLE